MNRSVDREYHTEAQRQYRRRKAMKAHGHTFHSDLFPAAPLRKKIKGWLRYHKDVTHREIAQFCQVDVRTIGRLMNESQYVTRHLRDRLLEFMSSGARVPHPRQHVDAAHSLQLLSSLQAQGWRISDLAEHTDISPSQLNQIIYDKRDHVYFETEQRVKALAAKIEDSKGPSPIAAARARARGFYPLIHYTDDGKLIPSSIPEQR